MPEEQRKHLRLPVESRVFIELLSPDMVNNDPGKIVTCRTLNVSRRGLLVSIEHEVTVGAILQVGIQMPHEEEPLYLAAQVEWCRSADDGDGEWSVGFTLMNANNSDIDSWESLLATLEN